MQRKGAIIAGQSNDTVPGAPTIGTITPGIGQLSIAFTVGSDGGRPITSYDISTDNGVSWTNTVQTSSPFLITGLQSGVEYSVKIRAYNMEGYGPWSTMVPATPYGVPDAPTITGTSPGVKSIYVTFIAPVFNGGKPITNYEYSLGSGGWVAFSPISTSSPLQITGLSDGTSYSIRIRAYNLAGGGTASNTATETTANVPSKPNPPSIGVIGNGSVSISWISPVANYSTITSYSYQYSSNNGSAWSTALSTFDTSATIGSLTNGTNYVFRVKAINGVGESDWSEKSLDGKPFTVPTAPQSVSAVKGDTQASISWSAPSSNGGYAIYDYHVDYKPSGGSWTGAGTATGTSKTITSLSNGTSYTFRVQASNSGDTAAYGAYGESNAVTPSGVPAQVAKPTLTAGDKSITVTWVAPGSNGSDITGFKIQYSSNGGTSWTSGGTALATATTKDITAANGSAYIARVLAYNANGDGSYSTASDSATPFFAAPTVSATSTADRNNAYVRTVTISFNPPDAVNYDRTEVYVAYDGQEGYLTDANTLKATKTSSDGVGDLSISFTAVNQYFDYGTFGTFWQSTDLAYDNVIRYRVITYNSDGYSRETTGSHTVLARQSYTYDAWSPEADYTGQTGTFVVNANTFTQESNWSLPGVNTQNVGDTQYRVTSLTIEAWVVISGINITTASRRFYVDWVTGTDINVSTSTKDCLVTPFSTNSGTTHRSLDWNASNIDYGNATKGRVRVRGGGTTGTYSTNPDQRIRVIVYMNGKSRTYTTYTVYY
jgi:hypothetical protein